MSWNPFASYHPAIPFCYLLAASAFAMSAAQPVYAALSLAGACCCVSLVRGVRALTRAGWLVGAIAVCTFANLLFVDEGTTVLFSINGRSLTLEAALFGACSGVMLAAVLCWMSSYASCVDGEATETLLGGAAPTVALMVSQIMRLVPQFARRGRMIESAAAATPVAAPRSAGERGGGHLRTVSVLVGWGLEDSLVRARAMQARGYAFGAHRTRYRRVRFRRADAVVLAVALALAAVNIPLVAIACGQYAFYPATSRLIAWWGYAPYAAFVFLPAALAIRERSRWRA